MDLFPLVLVMLASVLHLGWNAITKKADSKLFVLWVATFFPGIVGSIICFFIYDLSAISKQALLCLCASAVVHAVYFWSLAKAYLCGDLSVVYPYTRGIGALFAALGGVVFLHEYPSFIGGVGIGVIIIATLLEPILLRHKVRGNVDEHRQSFYFIILTALMIGAYLIIDTAAVRLMPVWPYLMWMHTLSAILLTPFLFQREHQCIEVRRHIKLGLGGAVFLYCAYGLALMAMEIAPLAYVASARTLGIIVSGAVGYLFFKEALTKYRIVSIFLICLGIILISAA